MTYTVSIRAGLVENFYCGLTEKQANRKKKEYEAMGWFVKIEPENNDNVSKSVLNHGKS